MFVSTIQINRFVGIAFLRLLHIFSKQMDITFKVVEAGVPPVLCKNLN